MKTVIGFFAAGVLLVSPVVFAGQGIVDDPAVTIVFAEDEDGNVLDHGWARGQMWSARSSKNDVEMIGCSYKAIEFPDGDGGFFVYKWGFCQAQDVNEVHVVCYTDNSELLDAMQATSAFAWVNFRFTTPDHDIAWRQGVRRCTRLDYSTQSFHLPEFTTVRRDDDEVDDD